MRILVYPHDLGMGGSQLNAIELAAAVRDRGHDVVVYGRPGVLAERVDELGLELVESPPPGRRPSAAVVRHLRSVVRARSIDVVHGYEWPPVLEARGAALAGGTAATVGTVMSMAVAPFIPRGLPLVVGTRQIAAHETRAGRRHVTVLEPPVDVDRNSPHARVDVGSFQRRHDIPAGLHVVVVSRLVPELKLEGILTAVQLVPTLAPDVVLTVVGGGGAHEEVRRAAEAANARAGRRAVVVTGEVRDPRPAYAMADVALGMGGSALRAMAFAKPLVVQGEKGFWLRLEPSTAATFQWTGWYGVGDGRGPDNLAREMAALLTDPGMRARLGAYSREVVTRHHSLEAAAATQLEVYRAALATGRRPTGEDGRALGRLARYKAARVRNRLAGRACADDFNANPVAASQPAGRDTLVYLAGVRWDGPPGTDRRLATALSRHCDVVWVDPPVPLQRAWRQVRGTVDRVAPAVVRLTLPGPPGVTRVGARTLADAHVSRKVLSFLASHPSPRAVVLANPLLSFPRHPGATRVLYVTDDWVAGAPLMGLSAEAVRRFERRNAREADLVMAVTPSLADVVGARTGVHVEVLANGCTVADPAVPAASIALGERPVAGVTGQLNERLDLDVLEAVADEDVSLLLVGGRTDRETRFVRRLDDLLARPNVRWAGPQPPSAMATHLSTMHVGLTPYANTEFNRASFPIKTLDYLAAGLRCVATPSPAVTWLGTDLVDVADTPAAFAAAVVAAAAEPSSAADRERRRDFARRHTWSARAGEVLAAVARHDGLASTGATTPSRTPSRTPTHTPTPPPLSSSSPPPEGTP